MLVKLIHLENELSVFKKKKLEKSGSSRDSWSSRDSISSKKLSQLSDIQKIRRQRMLRKRRNSFMELTKKLEVSVTEFKSLNGSSRFSSVKSSNKVNCTLLGKRRPMDSPTLIINAKKKIKIGVISQSRNFSTNGRGNHLYEYDFLQDYVL